MKDWLWIALGIGAVLLLASKKKPPLVCAFGPGIEQAAPQGGKIVLDVDTNYVTMFDAAGNQVQSMQMPSALAVDPAKFKELCATLTTRGA